MNIVPNDFLSMNKVFGIQCALVYIGHTYTHTKPYKQSNHIGYIYELTCNHGMRLMSEYDDAHVDAMLMLNMQDNTRSVTAPLQKSCPKI